MHIVLLALCRWHTHFANCRLIIYTDIGLHRTATCYLWWGLSSNTRRTYDTACCNYITHCTLEGTTSTAFPPSVANLCHWVAGLGNAGHTKTATIKLYLTSLQSYCVDLGLADLTAFEDPQLQRILCGIKIFHAVHKTDPREMLPITCNILLRLIAHLDQNAREGATFYAAFYLAFAAFLHISEFTWSNSEWQADEDFRHWHITRNSVQFHPPGRRADRAYLTLPASKTDPFRRGITLTIAATGDEACAVSVLYRLLDKWPVATHSPLFSNIHLTHNMTSRCFAAFDRTYVLNKLRDLLAQAGIICKGGGRMTNSSQGSTVFVVRETMVRGRSHDLSEIGVWHRPFILYSKTR